MAVPCELDIATGFRTRWAAFASLAAVIPVAHLYLGRTAEQTAFPRARLTVEAGDRELTSGSLVLCKFALTLDCFLLGSVAGTLGDLLSQLMNWHNCMAGPGRTLPNGSTVSVWALPNGSMISVKPVPGGTTKPTGEQRDGDDVVQVSGKWEALAEGHRSTNSFT